MASYFSLRGECGGGNSGKLSFLFDFSVVLATGTFHLGIVQWANGNADRRVCKVNKGAIYFLSILLFCVPKGINVWYQWLDSL